MAVLRAGMSATSLSAMQEMSNATILASQHPDADTIKFRKNLNNIFRETIEKPELDAEMLRKLLECFMHCIREYPQIYVTSMHNPNVLHKKNKVIATSFSRWVLAQIFLLLSKHRFNVEIEDRWILLIVDLVKLANLKDLPFFAKISSELISFAADLQAFKARINQTSKFERNLFALESKEGEIRDLYLDSPPICVESIEDCERLQMIVVQVLTENLNDIVQCLPRNIDLLWLLLCYDVDAGGPQLKFLALTALSSLKSCTLSLPSNPQVVRVIFTCIMDSISFITTAKDVPRLESLEASLVNAIKDICSGSKWSDFVTFSDVPSSLVKALALTESRDVGLAIGELLTDIVRCCALSTESFFDVQTGVACLINQKNRFSWISKVLGAIIIKEGETQRVEKPKNSPERVPPSVITSTRSIFPGAHCLERTETWKTFIQHWTLIFNTLLKGVDDGLSALLSHCQMIEVLVFLRTYDEDFSVTTIVLQTWDTWSAVILNAVSWTPEELARLYVVALRYSVALLDRHVVHCLNDEISSHLIGMLGLPWISIIIQHDFPDSSYQNLTKLSAHFRPSLVNGQMGDALYLVLAFPTTICIEGRVRLMQKTLKSPNCNFQEESIRALPMLLHFGGVDYFDSVENSVGTIASSEVVSVSKMLWQNFGFLICALCKASKSCTVFCKTYHLTCLPDGTENLSEKCLKQLHRLIPLIVHHQNSEVRLAFVENLDHILSHVGKDWTLADKCLAFLEDDNYHVRYAFSKHMPRYVALMHASGVNFETLVSRFKMAYMTAKGHKRWRTVETIILSLTYVGRMADDDMVVVIVVLLLENLFSPAQYVISTSCMQLRCIAEWRGMKTQALFLRFRKPICKILSIILYESQERGDVGPVENLGVLVKVFGFADLKSLIVVALPDLLPHLLCTTTQDTTSVLKSLSRHVQKNKIEILIDHFKYIFCYLVCYCSKAQMQNTLDFVQKETEVDIIMLFRSDCQQIQNELLLQSGNCYEQVVSGLKMLASKDDTYSRLKIDSPEDVAAFLQPRFLGFLTFFDALMQNATVPLPEKLSAIQSLVSVFSLMGTKHITSVRMKMLTTLRITLRFKEKAFIEVCCKAWDAFIRRLDIMAVGPMLGQIFVTILPLLINCQHELADTLNYLFVENRINLQEHFRDLYFIPEVPGLLQVYSVLSQLKKSSNSALASRLIQSCRFIAHENVDIRLNALKNLRGLLAERNTEVHALVLGQDSGDPLVSKLVHCLIIGCRDPDLRIRELLGQCLGELGAIDPGRLEIQIESEKEDQSRSCSYIDDDTFAIELVTELARAYLAALDTRIQDCSSFALQEVLRVYEFKKTDVSESSSSASKQLWEQLSDDVKEIVSPLLNSKYAMSRQAQSSSLTQPIYCSSMGRTFHDWMKYWAAHLSSKVTRQKAKKIFVACSMIIRNDIHTCQFLLPRILMCVLQEGNQGFIEEAYQEVLTVLNNTAETMVLYPDLHHMSVQTVFSLLDFLRKWVTKNGGSQLTNEQEEAILVDESANADLVRRVQAFLDRISNQVLALSSYRSQAYTRALMHHEIHIRNNPESLQNELSFLQKLYGALDEPDGVAGVISLRLDASLEDSILSHESTGQLQDALSCYERAIHLDNDNLSNHQGLLRCMMGLDQPHMALTYANGLLSRRTDWMPAVNRYRVEAAWKLTSWGELDSFLKSDNTSNSWEVGIGKVLQAVKTKEKDLHKHLAQLRLEQIAPISAASMENGSYQRGYDFIVRLHMVNEMEKAISSFTGLSSPDVLEALLEEWCGRQQLIQPSTRCLEPLMSLRRVLLSLAIENMPDQTTQLEQEIGRCFLRSAKVARKCGHLQRAYSYLLTATKFQLPEIYREQAKWHWQKGEQDSAISCLNKVIREHYSDLDQINAYQSSGSSNFKSSCAKAKLLLARYTEESGHLESNAMVGMYKEVLEMKPDWEDCNFYLARYYDRIFLNNTNDRSERKGELVVSVIKYFGQSLLYGCRNIYQSLPRLLSLWLDFSAAYCVDKVKKTCSNPVLENTERIVTHMNQKIIGHLFQQLPLYLFLTAFSQLVSRISHANMEVFAYLKDILARLLVKYPQQAMWMMTSVSKSSNKNRVARCREIFSRAQSMDPTLYKFLADAVKLTDMLLELSNKKISVDRKQFSINKEFQGLVVLLQNPNFSRISIPIQSSMTVKLPTAHGVQRDYEPFPKDLVCIASIHDLIELMPSLQRPKKFSFVGTDGQKYPMMCKPNDDLRKDFRLMEFNSVVNKFLLRDPESRRRQLHIRTYAVVPLNEQCGVIEWVPNLSTMRNILNTAYKDKGLYSTGQLTKSLALSKSAPVERKVENFKTKILPRFPPVFGDWLLKTFPDPTAWYLARLSYARTVAVMSMVGYILGLGDRHLENILFDCSCGDVVHVDFNCLFNKGETFECPELVPFRLTHNMVEAMGPLGYEGVYRKSCEVSLRVMRKQRDALMSILRPFVYDPLLEFSRPTKNTKEEPGEMINEKAKVNVRDIEHRLEGKLKNKTAKAIQSIFPLSIEGQVNYLILEATDHKNLAQMYMGWAPHM